MTPPTPFTLSPHTRMCIYPQKGNAIPAPDKAVQLQDDFDAYVSLVRKGTTSPETDRLERKIQHELEEVAIKDKMMKMIASAGISDWTFRRFREMYQDLGQVS